MSSRILQGDVFAQLTTIKPGSVDICVTSPPYWALRSYLAKDHPLKHLELGSEPDPQTYVENMVRVFELVKTALAEHGTCWLNIGDTYASTGRSDQEKSPKGTAGQVKEASGGGIVWGKDRHSNFAWTIPGIGGAGNLCLIPQRLTIALQEAGWIVRSVVCWEKPSAMPQSVSGWTWRRCRVKVKAGWGENHPGNSGNGAGAGIKQSGGVATGKKEGVALWQDCPGCKKCLPNGGYVLRRGSWRPTSSYEPILMLAKSPNYFADGEPVKTPPAEATVSRDKYSRVLDNPDEQFAVAHDHETLCDGANLRDVWRIAAEPLKEKHYAAFPSELVRRCLMAGTSQRGYCPICSVPWVRVIESVDTGRKQKMTDNWDTGEGAHGSFHRNGSEAGEPDQPVTASKTIGWRPSCKCPDAEPRPALVLDPFCGSGRTALSAQRLSLDFIGVELNPDFVAMAERLLRENMPLFS